MSWLQYNNVRYYYIVRNSYSMRLVPKTNEYDLSWHAGWMIKTLKTNDTNFIVSLIWGGKNIAVVSMNSSQMGK